MIRDQYFVVYDSADTIDNIDFEDGTGPTVGPYETIRIELVPQILETGSALVPETVFLSLAVYGRYGTGESDQTDNARAIPRDRIGGLE